MATGVHLRHDTLRNALYVIENRNRPFGDGGYDCNICLDTRTNDPLHHRFKATHLALGPDGECTVSVGVLAEIRRAGHPAELRVVGETDAPPPLSIGRVGSRMSPVLPPREFRPAQDNANRRAWFPGGFVKEVGGVTALLPKLDEMKRAARRLSNESEK